MEEFDVNDLDDLVENVAGYYDDDDGGRDEREERFEQPVNGNELEENEQKRIVPVKIRVKKPQPKLDPERLRGPRGLSMIPSWFEGIQLKGKGHETDDLNTVMNRLEQWTHRLFPRYTFDDAIDKLEKLGKKNEVKVILKRIRMDMDNNDFVSQIDEDVVENPSQIVQEDAFDRITNNVDIFPVTSTPGVRNIELTEEQRQRMMQNRMLAEERRQAKIRARQKQELNDRIHTSAVTDSI